MKYTILFQFLIGLPFFGYSQQTISNTLTHDGLVREYILYVPSSYTGDEPVPLVFNFHGFGSNATQQMFYGDFRPIADTAGFIVVHPEGTLFAGTTTHWNVGGWTLGSTVDDVGFTEAMIDAVAGEYNINPDRVYSTGMSNGGYMSFLLACQMNHKIAAIASVTGSMTPQTYSACNPERPTPVMQIHGTADDVVPYDGEVWTHSIDEVMQYWTTYNNCGANPVSTDLPDVSATDGSTVTHMVYNDCDNQIVAEHFRVSGGGHTWPGAFVGLEGTNYDFDASAEIWRFFSQYDINGRIDPITSLDPVVNETGVKVYPNPTSSALSIEVTGFDHQEYQLISPMGKIVKRGSVLSNRQEVDLSGFPPGIYYLKVGHTVAKVLKSE